MNCVHRLLVRRSSRGSAVAAVDGCFNIPTVTAWNHANHLRLSYKSLTVHAARRCCEVNDIPAVLCLGESLRSVVLMRWSTMQRLSIHSVALGELTARMALLRQTCGLWRSGLLVPCWR